MQYPRFALPTSSILFALSLGGCVAEVEEIDVSICRGYNDSQLLEGQCETEGATNIAGDHYQVCEWIPESDPNHGGANCPGPDCELLGEYVWSSAMSGCWICRTISHIDADGNPVCVDRDDYDECLRVCNR